MHPMLNTAVKAARRAASIVTRASNNLDVIKVERKQQNDFVSEVDRAAEQAFLASSLAVQTDWLQAPHHGSRSSSSWPFLQRLAPTSVLISRGRSNTFGHPHPQVLERYHVLGSRVYDSAEQGAVRLRLGAFLPPMVARSQRRFWREPLP